MVHMTGLFGADWWTGGVLVSILSCLPFRCKCNVPLVHMGLHGFTMFMPTTFQNWLAYKFILILCFTISEKYVWGNFRCKHILSCRYIFR